MGPWPGSGSQRRIFWERCTVSVGAGCRAASGGLGAELDELALLVQGLLISQRNITLLQDLQSFCAWYKLSRK